MRAGSYDEGVRLIDRTNARDGNIVKGPYERLKYDFRRLWECPICGHRRWSPGTLTAEACDCTLKESPPRVTFMQLLAEGGRRTDGQQIQAVGTSAPLRREAPLVSGDTGAATSEAEQSSDTMPAVQQAELKNAAMTEGVPAGDAADATASSARDESVSESSRDTPEQATEVSSSSEGPGESPESSGTQRRGKRRSRRRRRK